MPKPTALTERRERRERLRIERTSAHAYSAALAERLLDTAEPFPYVWFWRVKHGDRKGQRCRMWARGTMNSVGVEFEDGFRTVTARYAIRKAS